MNEIEANSEPQPEHRSSPHRGLAGTTIADA
jgi:hypothetical protein